MDSDSDAGIGEALDVARVRAWLRSGKARAVRESAGMSQADVARAIGTDGPQVSRWESGTAAPRRKSALRLARLLDAADGIIQAKRAGAARLGTRE